MAKAKVISVKAGEFVPLVLFGKYSFTAKVKSIKPSRQQGISLINMVIEENTIPSLIASMLSRAKAKYPTIENRARVSFAISSDTQADFGLQGYQFN